MYVHMGNLDYQKTYSAENDFPKSSNGGWLLY